MLVIKDLQKSYDQRKIIDSVNIRLGKGQTLAVIGPSGCGKSTLLKCIAGILPYDSGSILLDEKPVGSCPQEIGFNFQEHNLFPWLKVNKNLRLGLIAQKCGKEEMERKIQKIAQDLGISHLLKCYPYTLSGGERQRVAIGRILAYSPSLLLLDEPSSALDAINKEKFQDLLLHIKTQYPITTVVVTHSIEEAVYLADYIMVMTQRGSYKIKQIHLERSPQLRKEISFFEACRQIRQELEEGENT